MFESAHLFYRLCKGPRYRIRSVCGMGAPKVSSFFLQIFSVGRSVNYASEALRNLFSFYLFFISWRGRREVTLKVIEMQRVKKSIHAQKLKSYGSATKRRIIAF